MIILMIENRPLKRHELTTNRPQKMPLVTSEELKFFSPKMLENILFFRRLGYNVIPRKGFPKPPEPQFTDPD